MTFSLKSHVNFLREISCGQFKSAYDVLMSEKYRSSNQKPCMFVRSWQCMGVPPFFPPVFCVYGSRLFARPRFNHLTR